MCLSEGGVTISVRTRACYKESFTGSYLENLFKEGIKRSSLIYYLRYQRPLNIHSIIFSADNQQIDLTQSLILYSLIDQKPIRSIGDCWKDPLILQKVLNYQKSKTALSREMAALYAYLYSKTKKNETERFSYLWMSMNGLYGAISPEIKNNDRVQMGRMLSKVQLGSETLTKDNRDSPCRKMMIRLINEKEPITRAYIESKSYNSFSEFIASALPTDNNGKSYDLTPYGFLITDFPYYLRCKLFHANKPIELFSFIDDMELKSLRIANGLLEEFLDDNLHKLFIGEFKN